MENPTLEQKVKSIIEQIRPYLQQDGGDIEFIELTPDYIVKVKLQGACGTCPHAKMTLKNGVEQTLKQHLPEIKAVEDIILGF
ncbi:MAG: NifU family protein [Bacteroidales bacterium]